MAKQLEWTADREADAVARLKRGGLTVLIYCRQSVSDFDEQGQVVGASLAVQAQQCRQRPEFAKSKIEVFTDADKSGKETDRRPQYQGMMARLREAPPGTIGAVAAYDLSRIHRATYNFFGFMKEMETRGIPVFTATEGLVRSTDGLSWGVKALVADEYRRNIGRRIHESKKYRRSQGVMQGRLPVGYRRAGPHQAELDPQAAPVVRELFSRYASGKYSLTTLADWLNQQGIKPPAVPFKPVSKPRDPDRAHWYQRDFWSATSIRGILKTRSYLGVVQTPSGEVKGQHPAIIDQQTWERCQQVAQRNRRRATPTWTRHSYPLTPLLKCGRCDGPVNGNRRLHKVGWVSFYRCPASRRYFRPKRDPASCDLPWLRADDIQNALLAELRALATPKLTAELKKGLGKVADPDEQYRQAMARFEKRIANIRWQHEHDLTDAEDAMERIGKVNVERNALRERWLEDKKQLALGPWDEVFAGIVASAVAASTNLPFKEVLPKARQRAAGKGKLGQHKQEATAVEFGLWAERLPELLQRIEVDVVKGVAQVVLVPKPEWVPYLRKKLPGVDSISFLRSNASSRVSNV